MIIFNLIGVLMTGIGILAGLLVGGFTSLFTRNEQLPIKVGAFVALPLMIIMDLAYRWRYNPERGRWRYVLPTYGGMFMLLPLWVLIGPGQIVIGIVLVIRKQLGFN